jgi:3-hydroxymyristoyl/3-hydroxydecanoyl-(acyl carrier protein) dehydratase
VQGAENNQFIESDAWLAAQADFDLPKVLSRVEEASGLVLMLDVVPEMKVFEGHFPGNPILPGIVQLHWAVGIAMAEYAFRDAPFEIKRLKFKSIVQPPRVLELTLCRSTENEVEFKFTSTDQVHSMGCFVVEEASQC